MGKKFRDNGKYCYYCNRKIGTECQWFKCPNIIEEDKVHLISFFVISLIIFVVLGGFYLWK